MNDRTGTERLLHHWREVLPHDRLAHLIRDVARLQMRALQHRLAEHDVSFGHWTFLRILWVTEGMSPRTIATVRKALLGMIENLATEDPYRDVGAK